MEIFATLVALPLLALAPFAVLLVKPLKRHGDRRVRVSGAVLGTLGLWLTFNLSLAACCAADVAPVVLEAPRMAAVVFLLLQVPAACVAKRIAFAEIA